MKLGVTNLAAFSREPFSALSIEPLNEANQAGAYEYRVDNLSVLSLLSR